MDLRFLLLEMETAAVRGWPALEAAGFDGWLWRHSTGGSVRANSVATLAYSGADPERSIAAVEALCKSRKLPVCFTISDVSEPVDLDARLEARGYVRGDDHVTMSKRVPVQPSMPADVRLAAAPSPEWMAIYLSGLSDDRRAAAPLILERLPPASVFVAAALEGQVITSGLTIGDGTVASVQCMATLPDARRQGGAQMVLRAIEHLAARDGRRAIYLQTSVDNLAAQALYMRAGFAAAGHYHTRTLLSP